MTELDRFLDGLGIAYLRDEPLSLHTSFRIGGPADRFVLPHDAEQLTSAVNYCRENKIRFKVVGRGSNLLFSDGGFRGAVICTSGLDFINVSGEEIEAGCGASVGKVCIAARSSSLTGMESLFGIPGSVGGAVFMNAGAYGAELKDVCVSVSWYDPLTGRSGVSPASGCDFGYRHSVFRTNGKMILSAKFSLSAGNRDEISAKMDDVIFRRTSKQPLDYPSAGSAFKRPEGSFASKLIDECGLKGFSVGDAEISEKHAGFIINKGSARCADVLALIEATRSIVRDNTGVDLTPEIEFVPSEEK